MSGISDILAENPVIAALRSDDDLERVLVSRVRIVFVLYGSVITLPEICKKLNEAGKTVYVHIDMIEGLKGDAAGVEFIRQYANPRGILTTRVNVVRCAKLCSLGTILRIFLIDSLSLKTGVKNISETCPDAVEIMPAVACRVIPGLEKQITVPIIAGGLITDKEQIFETLSAGAIAISTTRQDLWSL